MRERARECLGENVFTLVEVFKQYGRLVTAFSVYFNGEDRKVDEGGSR
jgi:hypothetical protein